MQIITIILSILIWNFSNTATKADLGHNIQSDLPRNFVRDGSVDYTNYMQNAIAQHSDIIFPGFPILINDDGLEIGSNKTITFLPGSELRLKPTSKGKYVIIRIKNATNVTLKNPVIKGDKLSHLGSDGEWGMGIGIYGSNNITLINPRVFNCWGDGIYLGTSSKVTNRNVSITNAYLMGNRRDGISIISVVGLKLENAYAAYSNGTLPMTGINFEPNSATDELKNIIVSNPRTEYNGGRGIQVAIRQLLGGGHKNIDITIIKPIDISAKTNAVKVSCKRKSEDEGGSVSGSVRIINPSWKKTRSGIPLLVSVDQPNLKTIITSAKVTNLKGGLLTSGSTNSLLKRGVYKGDCIIN